DSPLGSNAALEAMLADRGRAFDPDVLDALVEVAPQLEAVRAPSCAVEL
ncbi:MAG: hypothetical protein IRZ20_06490, partial [Thermoleophilia bacterium]|nr:hypothetical protein [Thermoleophilia bacterium]